MTLPEIPRRGKLPRSTQIILVIAGICAGTLLSALVWAWVARRAPLPTLTPARLETAQALWQGQGLTDYDLTVELSGIQQGTIEIQVRDQVVTAMTRNGATPSQRRTWQYWSVTGQFDMIEADLQNAQDPQQAFGVGDPNQVLMRATFDPKFGYPRHYQRIVLGSLGELQWQVTRFQPVP